MATGTINIKRTGLNDRRGYRWTVSIGRGRNYRSIANDVRTYDEAHAIAVGWASLHETDIKAPVMRAKA